MSACCICLDDKSSRSFAVLSGCGHWYHETCIRDWLNLSQVKKYCPLCKAKTKIQSIIVMPEEIGDSLSDSSILIKELRNDLKMSEGEIDRLKIDLSKSQRESQREIEELKRMAEIVQKLECREEENLKIKKILSNQIAQLKEKLNQSEVEYNNQTRRINVLMQEIDDERAKRIKAEAFTKPWNFSSEFDYIQWEKSWKEIRNSLKDRNDLEELLFEYHKKVGETNSWLIDSKESILVLKKKLARQKSLFKDLEQEYNSLKECSMQEDIKVNNQEYNHFKRKVIPPGSYKTPNISFNSLKSIPVNRVLIDSNQKRSTAPFKKVY